MATVPRANRVWWQRKIVDNQARDRRKEASLRENGFRVQIVWQCETRDLDSLERRLARFIAQNNYPKAVHGGTRT